MTIDLFDAKITELDLEVRQGRLTNRARLAMVGALVARAEAICDMQDILREAPRALTSASLVTTPSALELRIAVAPGHMHTWRMVLIRRGFEEAGVVGHGYEFRGTYVVRIAYPVPTRAAA